MTLRRTLLAMTLLGTGLALAGCETFDLESIWSTKKPLPGERRDMFPQGVPGVQQGVPPDLVQGYQPPPEPPPAAEAEKPKPAPRRVASPPKPAPPPRQAAPRPQRQQQQAQEEPPHAALVPRSHSNPERPGPIRRPAPRSPSSRVRPGPIPLAPGRPLVRVES